MDGRGGALQSPEEQEMILAKRIHRVLLQGDPPKYPGADLVGRSIPAQSVGGDFFDFVVTGAGHLRLVVADVMGKGVGAAMVMTMTRSAVRVSSESLENPSDMLRHINRVLYPDLHAMRSFVTLFCADYDPLAFTLTCATAGHLPPLLHRAKSGTVLRLPVKGMMLGALPNQRYAEVTIPLEDDDTLCLYSDGVTEAVSPAGAQLGVAGLSSLLAESRAETVGALLEELLGAVRSHLGSRPQRDDVTLALFKPQRRGFTYDLSLVADR